jgi:hypothetical protein
LGLKETVAYSWQHLIEELFDDCWCEDIKRYRSSYAFRGLSNKEYRLLTSLTRLGGPYADLEHHILKNFEKYARLDNAAHLTQWDWLTIAQHHGLPTRLLDWTYSPFVAMHFATCETSRYDKDGVIWLVNFKKTHKFLPNSFKNKLNEEGSSVFTGKLLSGISTSLQEFDGVSSKSGYALFFEPPSLDERIVNQSALHSVISNSTTVLDDILEKHPDWYKRIIIPKELKGEIRDKLDQANITERVLFPSLDGLSTWLKRYYGKSYSQKPAQNPQ